MTSTPHDFLSRIASDPTEFVSNDDDHLNPKLSGYLDHILQSYALVQSSSTPESESTNSAIHLTTLSLQHLQHAKTLIQDRVRQEMHDAWDGVAQRIALSQRVKTETLQLRQEWNNIIQQEDSPLNQLQSLTQMNQQSQQMNQQSQQLNQQSQLNHNASQLNQQPPPQSKVRQIQVIARLESIVGTLRDISKLERWLQEVQLWPPNSSSTSNNLLLQAKAVTNVLNLVNSEDKSHLQSIHLVQQFIRIAKNTHDTLRSTNTTSLVEGLKNQKHSQVADALQIFYELNILENEVLAIVRKAIQDTKQCLSNGLTVDSSLKRPGLIQRGTSSNVAKSQFLLKLKGMFSQIQKIFVEIWHLDRMLHKKKDPVSQVSFHEIVVERKQMNILESYWNTMTKLVTQDISNSTKSNQFVKNIFIEEYPQILDQFSHFTQGFASYTDFAFDSNVVTPSQWITMTLQDIQKDYLVAAISRMNEKTNLIFSRVRAPKNLADDDYFGISSSDTRSLAMSVLHELSQIKNHQSLQKEILKGVGSSIRHFTVQCETKMVSSPPEAMTPDVFKPPNVYQRFNAHIYNALCVLQSCISDAIPDFHSHPKIQTELKERLVSVEDLSRQILVPLFDSLKNRLEDILFSLHMESYNRSISSADMSSYVEQLSQSLSFVRQHHLALYNEESSTLKSLSKSTSEQLIHYYVRQISLVNPLGEEGKIILANDMAQVELTIGTNLYHVEKLGPTYKELKSFRKLLFMETSSIEEFCESLLKEIQPSLFFHHLLSRIPSGPQHQLIIRPHRHLNMSLESYNSFLDNHDLKGVIKELRESLKTAKTQLNGDEQEEWQKEAINVMDLIDRCMNSV